MAAPATINEFLDLVRKSGVLDEKRLDAHVEKLRTAGSLPSEPGKLAGVLVRDGLLTTFQAENILQGKWRRFTIGKYKVLERLGAGGMGSVYLCEHKLMRRRVAVKVLPTAKAADPSSLERFYREARAVAALDHPNIVHAYDIDQDETLHFIVMEYVDGASLQDIIKKAGPMSPVRAAHYIRQSALGLEHAQGAGLVHRDVKPGNLLVDRTGVVKVLDMGLARFFNDDDDILTKKYDENVLGTADYLAPEQAVDSHSVDIRADIYSLGATFYYLLTGRTPFGEGTVAQKLIWHQSRQPKPLTSFRSDVPPGMVAVIDKMMAKDPVHRYQTPGEVVEALQPWTQSPIGPPPEAEMPRLSPAATGIAPGETTQATSTQPVSPSPRKPWQVVAPAGSGAKTVVNPATPAAQATATAASPLPPVRPASETPTHPMHVARTATAPTPPTPAAAPMVRTREASNGIMPAPALPAVPTEDAEAIAWEDVTTEPEEGEFDTGAAGKPPSSRRRLSRSRPTAVHAERRRTWLVLLVVCAVFLSALGVVSYLFILHKPVETVVPERKPRLVTQDPSILHAFRSVHQALREAQPGDVIELLDDIHKENLLVDPKTGPTGVTLQVPPGKNVVWISKSGLEKDPLIRFTSASGFRLKGKGLTLEGQNKTAELMQLLFECPGLTIEDVQFKGFSQSGILVLNCSGTKDRPVRIVDVTIAKTTKDEPRAAIFFDAKPGFNPPINEYIEMSNNCKFPGLDQQRAIAYPVNAVIGRDVRLPAGINWAPPIPAVSPAPPGKTQ